MIIMNSKNLIKPLFITFISCFLLPSCMPGSQKAAPSGVVVINVLEKKLYDDCHIEGSVHVPFEMLEQYAQQNLDKSTEIVVYCSNYMCAASGQGCKMLKRLGFEHVYAYEGGTAEWYQNKMPVVGPCTAHYLQKKLAPIDHSQEDGEPAAVMSMQDLACKLHLVIEK
jgi:rhodanese-related sulfurtransferase